jgi:branched-chain amino acid transport system ATP-binding protein
VGKEEAANFAKATQVLEFVELIHLRDEYAENLSGGQKKLLELARTLMCDPQMILLDEPGAGVNRVLMRKLTADIERLRRELGITFLVIEHDMDLVTQLCDTVIVMSEGAKLAQGTAEEVKSDERVLEAYLGGQYR